jgi:hypothetical protein
MKKLVLLSSAAFAMLFTSCENLQMQQPLEKVAPCTNLQNHQIISEIRYSEGIIKNVKVWVPKEDAPREVENLTQEDLELVETWVIIPDKSQNSLLEPCFLPPSYRTDGLRINFEGTVVHSNEPRKMDGTTPFILRGIADNSKPEC